MMLLVPAPTEKMKAVNGAMRVICFGRFSMTPAATETIQSMPPAACIMEAAVTTARMIAIAAAGGSPGTSPKTKTSTNVPRPPHRPTPTPPALVPITMAPRTTRASSTNETLMSLPLPGSSSLSVLAALHGRQGLDPGPAVAHVLQCVLDRGPRRVEGRVAVVDSRLELGAQVVAQRGEHGVQTALRHRLQPVEALL